MKYFKSLTLVLVLILGFHVTSQSQIRIRTSIGTKMNNAYQQYDSRSLAWNIVGEYDKLYPGTSSGFYLSYAGYSYQGDEVEPGISIGASNTAHLDELLEEFGVNVAPYTLGGRLSPYVSLLLGINFGAGFSANNVVVTETGVSIFTIKIPVGITFYPVKNVGIFTEFFGPQSKINGGVAFRFGWRR